MTRAAAALVATVALVGAAGVALARRADTFDQAPVIEGDSWWPGFDPFAFDVTPDTFGPVATGAVYVPPPEDAMHPLLQLIRRYESDNRYNVVFGGGLFSDLSIHPFATRAADGRDGEYTRRGIAPARIAVGTNRGRTSTAAGAYQFIVGTWRRLARAHGIQGFDQAAQDALALAYLRERGALRLYAAGDLEGSIRAAARAWTSLPSSSTGESRLNMAAAVDFLESVA
jgi:muramidase (phage lysozyme)